MSELFTCKGKYSEAELITLVLRHETDADRAIWRVWHLEQAALCGTVRIKEREQEIILPALESGDYGVEICLYLGNRPLERLRTAVNVGDRVVRYGFLSDFREHDTDAVSELAKYHITHVQFYDWCWKHDTLVSPEEEYQDMMGKRNSLPVIRERIAACNQRGMLAMAYGAVYAASKPFWDEHRSWGLYGVRHQPMTFIDTFYYMDIDSPWRDHLMRQYREAIMRVGFDGIHMDTYGEPKWARTEQGTIRALEGGFPKLIRDTDAFLWEAGIEPHLIFNNVGTWPVRETRDCPQEAVYMELWPPMDRYHHIREAVQAAGAHPVVLAAYPAPFRTDEPERALYSQLFLSFAIALQGATQLFLGEKNAVVTQGYYADYSVLSAQQAARIRAYEDFFVQYGDLFYDRSLRDLTYTHFGGDNVEYRVDSPCSADGEAGKLWITVRENEQRKLIGVINLCGNRDEHWNTGKDKPVKQENIAFHVLVRGVPEMVWYASPDDASAEPKPLSYALSNGRYGPEITFIVPSLFCCALIGILL